MTCTSVPAFSLMNVIFCHWKTQLEKCSLDYYRGLEVSSSGRWVSAPRVLRYSEECTFFSESLSVTHDSGTVSQSDPFDAMRYVSTQLIQRPAGSSNVLCVTVLSANQYSKDPT